MSVVGRKNLFGLLLSMMIEVGGGGGGSGVVDIVLKV
jgi:hypothetical protein